jgi:hypothetical protein
MVVFSIVRRIAYLAGMTLALLACQRQAAAPLPDTDAPLALLARPTLAGPRFDPAAVSGKAVVVNVWSPS